MNDRARTLIESLRLEPHPEGGWYCRLFRSERTVKPDDGRANRHALTAIYFLLATGQHSRWHCVKSDEIWTFLEGDPVVLTCFDAETREMTEMNLGPYAADTEPIRIVPAGIWQAAMPLGEYALVGCFVGPGFEFDDFALAADHYEIADMIRAKGEKFGRLVR